MYPKRMGYSGLDPRAAARAAAHRQQTRGHEQGLQTPQMMGYGYGGLQAPMGFGTGFGPGSGGGRPDRRAGGGGVNARDAPCHPIGMSKTEADAETVLAQMEDAQAAKRPRGDDAAAAAADAAEQAALTRQLAPLLQSVEVELRQVQAQLGAEVGARDTLISRLDQINEMIERTSREHRQKVMLHVRGDPETQRKMEKYKGKLEKAEQHERLISMRDNEKRTKALRKGIEKCDDGEIRLLASRQSELSPQESKQLLGIGDPSAAVAAAKKLMAKLHPDRCHVEACKEGLRMRFQLVQHAKDVLQPPTT